MIPRILAEEVRKAACSMPVLGVTGPRQSGKTTLVRSVFSDYAYFNLEDPALRLFAREDPRGLLQQGLAEKQGIIIDEAQHVPELFSYVQLWSDERRSAGQFVLTGSQHFLLMEKITQSLAGRIALFNLLPLSLEELRQTEFAERDFPFFIFRGFYPRLYAQEIPVDLFYSSYIATYLQRDVRTLTRVMDLDDFTLFLKLIAGRTGQLLNKSELSVTAGLSHATVKRWLSILKTSFVITSLQPYYKNYNKRLVKSSKIYFYDTGLACNLLSIREEKQLLTHHLLGSLFENFVITELMKHFLNRGLSPNFYFWRDNAGHEIDLLIEYGGKLYPVEIKAARTLRPAFFDNLRFFKKLAGKEVGTSYLIYGGQQRQSRSEGIEVRPWNELPNLGEWGMENDNG